MKYLFLFLFLTACGQKTENSEPKPEADAKNITNIALAKYQAREALTGEELQALRKPVPDWKTYKRLIQAEDGFDDLRRFYLATNIVAQNLDWNSIVYYDPRQESYYHGAFKPTNINGWQDLINTKKDPAQEVYGRDRVVLISNISPSLHIYADAYNDYKFYELELKSTIDEYGLHKFGGEGATEVWFSYMPVYTPKNPALKIKWKTTTNIWRLDRVKYIATTNGSPIVNILKHPNNLFVYDTNDTAFGWSKEKREETIMNEFTNTYKPPLECSYLIYTNNIYTNSNHVYTNEFPVSIPFTLYYSEETKELYYGEEYGFYGDIALITNDNPPVFTNYDDWGKTTREIIDWENRQIIRGWYPRTTNGVLDIRY